jgi:hypothetical protein
VARTKERWREIPGFSWYEASDLGRIRSYKPVNQYAEPPKRPKLMRTRRGTGGYLRVTMQDDKGEKRVVPVHLAVAWAWLGPPRGRVVRHLDGDVTNVKKKNLKYGSQEENIHDKYEHGTHAMGEQNSAALLTEKQVLEIYALKGIESQKSLATRYAISRQAVSDIHRGVTWSEVTDDF